MVLFYRAILVGVQAQVYLKYAQTNRREKECPMKLLRHGPKGQEKPGLLDPMGRVRDLSNHIGDLNRAALEGDQLKRLARLTPEDLPIVEGSPRLGVPIADIGNVICIGLNYRDHAEESGMAIPAEPIVFSKTTSAISGPSDPVIIPQDSEKTDWEVELCVVVGKRAQYVDEADAFDHVAGYTVINDVSERSFQIDHGGQWIKGKSAESFAPIGPWLVTADEIADPQNLNLWLDVNGKRRQTGNTKSMIYGVAFLVSYLSRFMVLQPGDVIATGTPPGVGMGQKPPVFLKPGDEIGYRGPGGANASGSSLQSLKLQFQKPAKIGVLQDMADIASSVAHHHLETALLAEIMGLDQ